jgi:CheY-like chemotaxis protein
VERNLGAVSPTILVVDDEPFIRLTLADHLKDCGFLVIEACDGEEAIEVLEALPDVALVFSDVRMPGKVDGIALAQWIRSNMRDVPVFLASGDMGKPYSAEEVCAVRFFAKPYDFDILVKTISETLHS